jgi:hypothetical protein
LKSVLAAFKMGYAQGKDVAMNDDTDDRDLDRADQQILCPELPDEALEGAATLGGTIPTGSVNIIPPNCC